jgi:hypothetical protein
LTCAQIPYAAKFRRRRYAERAAGRDAGASSAMTVEDLSIDNVVILKKSFDIPDLIEQVNSALKSVEAAREPLKHAINQ